MSPNASAPVAASSIEVRGLRKRFGGQVILDGVDLDVASAEMFALVGVNGAGKTTCIKTLLDFSSADGGHIRIDGIDHRQPRARAGLHFLPERFAPPHFLSGEEFLRYTARLHAEPYRPERVADVLADLELDHGVLRRPVRLYSKGMAQKLGLAGALLSGRRLLLLDEPMSGLDPRARVAVKRRLRAEREAGRTVFMTTHMLSDVQALCDRMAILHGGRCVFLGSPQACQQRFGGGDLEEAFLNCLAAEDAASG